MIKDSRSALPKISEEATKWPLAWSDRLNGKRRSEKCKAGGCFTLSIGITWPVCMGA